MENGWTNGCWPIESSCVFSLKIAIFHGNLWQLTRSTCPENHRQDGVNILNSSRVTLRRSARILKKPLGRIRLVSCLQIILFVIYTVVSWISLWNVRKWRINKRLGLIWSSKFTDFDVTGSYGSLQAENGARLTRIPKSPESLPSRVVVELKFKMHGKLWWFWFVAGDSWFPHC